MTPDEISEAALRSVFFKELSRKKFLNLIYLSKFSVILNDKQGYKGGHFQ